MEEAFKPITIFYDTKGDTLTVWFDDPKKEVIVEETGEEILISKDRQGRAIGIEVLNFSLHRSGHAKPTRSLPVKTAVV